MSTAAGQRDLAADPEQLIPVRPAQREFHQHATGTDDHFHGDFDQPAAPRAGLAFAQRIALASTVAEPLLRGLGQRRRGDGIEDSPLGRCRRFRRGATQSHQQVRRGGVQEQPEKIRHEPMIAQAVGMQPVFQFLVAVLAFAAQHVFVVRSLGHRDRAGAIGDDGPAVRPQAVRFAFHDHRPRARPTVGLILDQTAEDIVARWGVVTPSMPCDADDHDA